MNIQPNENRISGKWEFSNGKMIADSNCERIKFLKTEVLQKIATDQSGWQTLYFNKEDGSYWELTFPQSELNGGGPPELCRILDLDKMNMEYNVETNG